MTIFWTIWGVHAYSVLVSAFCRNNLFKVRERRMHSPARKMRALPRLRDTPQLFTHALFELCARVFAVELRDETGADLGGTHCFALVSVGAITKSLLIHYLHHFQHTSLAFGCALRQK